MFPYALRDSCQFTEQSSWQIPRDSRGIWKKFDPQDVTRFQKDSPKTHWVSPRSECSSRSPARYDCLWYQHPPGSPVILWHVAINYSKTSHPKHPRTPLTTAHLLEKLERIPNLVAIVYVQRKSPMSTAPDLFKDLLKLQTPVNKGSSVKEETE